MKDNFSNGSDNYARYRPTYPAALFDYLNTLTTTHENAWDCATGNGQAAQRLAAFFTRVYATDISRSQLHNAVSLPNIFYSVQPAEQTNFPSRFFDLVMVAQAVHWFHFDRFYAEVARTAKEGALLVIAGYGRLTVTPEVDAVISRFYVDIIGFYWDKERRYIDEQYQTIPFPFEELQPPAFYNVYEWTLEHLVGYLQTWSAVKHYQKEKGTNPLLLIEQELRNAWGGVENRMVQFPLLLRIGRIR